MFHSCPITFASSMYVLCLAANPTWLCGSLFFELWLWPTCLCICHVVSPHYVVSIAIVCMYYLRQRWVGTLPTFVPTMYVHHISYLTLLHRERGIVPYLTIPYSTSLLLSCRCCMVPYLPFCWIHDCQKQGACIFD